MRTWWKPAVATLAAFVALSSWAVSSPVGSSPDEDFHLASIWCSPAARGDLCSPGTKLKNREVAFALTKRVACYAEDETKSAACQVNRKVFETSKTAVTERGNFLSKYPPVFYATMSVFAGPDVRASVVAMRLFNVALFSLLTLSACLLVGRRWRFVLGAALLTTLVPLGVSLVASLNPSSWTIAGTCILFVVSSAIFENITNGRAIRHERGRFIGQAIVASISFIMAAGSRSDGALFALLAVSLAFGLARTWTVLRNWTLLIVAGFVVLTSAFLFVTRNTVFTPSELSDFERNAGKEGRAFLVVLGKNVLAIPDLLRQFFGSQGLGWLDTGMPAIATLGAMVVFVAVMSVRIVQARRQTLWVLGAGAIAVVLVPLAYLQVRNAFVGESFQARYLLPLVIVLAAVALAGGREPVIPRRIAILALPVLILANAAALYANMSRYIQGGKATSWNLDEAKWWWTNMPSPMVVWIVGSVAFAIAATAVLWPAIRRGAATTEADVRELTTTGARTDSA